MPRKGNEKRIAIGIPERVYKEMLEFANKQNPKLFIYEVVVLSWEKFKKIAKGFEKKK